MTYLGGEGSTLPYSLISERGSHERRRQMLRKFRGASPRHTHKKCHNHNAANESKKRRCAAAQHGLSARR